MTTVPAGPDMSRPPTPEITDATWIISCSKCSRWRTLREVGGIRIAAASAGKRTLGWCRECGRPRLMRIEQARNIPHDRLGAMIAATEGTQQR